MRTVFKYYKSYIPLIVGILAFLFGQAMCELALPGYMSDIINNGIVKGDMDYIKKIGLIMILVSCGSVICSIVSSYLAARTAAGSARKIRGALFDKVTDFSAAELSEFSTASLITRSTNDVQMVQQTTVLTLLRPDYGYRSYHQSAAYQCVPVLDGRRCAGGHRGDHADVIFPGIA